MTLIALTNKEAQHIIVPTMRVTFLFFSRRNQINQAEIKQKEAIVAIKLNMNNSIAWSLTHVAYASAGNEMNLFWATNTE